MNKFLLTTAMILVSLFSIFPITMSEYHFISDFQKDNPFWKTGSLIKSDVAEWVCYENAGLKKTTEIKRLRPDKTCSEISKLNENGLKSMSEIFVYYPVIDKDGSQTGDILKESMIRDEKGLLIEQKTLFLETQIEYTSNYKYDNNNNLKTELFYKNGELQSTINYSFKLEAGKIIEKKSIKHTGKKLIETSVF